MVTIGEAALVVMRSGGWMKWFLLVIGDLTSSLDGWSLFQYLVKEDWLLLSMVWWWFASPYKGLPAVPVCALVIIVHRRPRIRREETRSTESILDDNHPLPVQHEETRSTGSILNANYLQPIQLEEPLSTENILDANHPQPVQQEEPRSTVSILDANQVEAAIGSIRISMEDNHGEIILVRSPESDLSDSDRGSSSSSNDEIIHYWHAPMNSLEAGDANLIDPGFMEMLEEMNGGLSAADAAEIVRTVFRHAPESDGSYRLSDINENQWILHAGTEAFANPPALTDISTQSFVMMSKITAKLCHLIWLEFAGQNWQLCQEVRKECFLGVVGQSLQKLVDVAVSFCKARWSADYNLQMLTMFDGLIDVLYSIRDLPLDRYDFIHNKVAYIFQKMIYGIKRVIEGTADDIHVSDESSIHPATVVLLEVLEFLCRNSDMTQHLLDSEDYNTDPCSNIFDYWVSKLEKSARKMFPNKGQRFIFILNNLYFVLQKKCYQGVPLNLDSQIEKYIERYLDEYWVPLVRHLDGETHRSSLVYFAGKFENTCHTQMKWKVRTELKKILRDKIEILIVAKYANLFDTLQANPRWHWRFRFNGICRGRSQKQKIGALFEL